MRTLTLAIVIVAFQLLPLTDAQAQTAPQDERFVFGDEARSLRGVVLRGVDRNVFATDTAQGTVYRWPGMLDSANQSTISASASFSAPGSVGGITLNENDSFPSPSATGTS